VLFTGLGALQAPEKTAILEYEKTPSKASVTHDMKGWFY